jgi:tetratricopeptide (TPR) repeat protein
MGSVNEENVILSEQLDASDEHLEPERREDIVPAWLALLVLVLLLAVVGVGGYVIRGLIDGRVRVTSPEDLRINEARKQLRTDPGNLEVRLQLAYAYQKSGRLDSAIKEYENVLQRDPQNTAALYNEGVIYLSLKIDKRAEERFWDVLEIDRTHELAAQALGDYYAQRKEYRSLIKAVRPVVKARPELADLQYLMGVAYENLGRKDWALARYRLALKYSPDMPDAKAALTRLETTQ